MGFGIWAKHSPGNEIWTKFGLWNGIYTLQDFHINDYKRLIFELVPDEPVSQLCRGIKFPLTPCKLDQSDTRHFRSLTEPENRKDYKLAQAEMLSQIRTYIMAKKYLITCLTYLFTLRNRLCSTGSTSFKVASRFEYCKSFFQIHGPLDCPPVGNLDARLFQAVTRDNQFNQTWADTFRPWTQLRLYRGTARPTFLLPLRVALAFSPAFSVAWDVFCWRRWSLVSRDKKRQTKHPATKQSNSTDQTVNNFTQYQSQCRRCGFVAQSVVEHRTGIAEVMGSNPVEARTFSGFFFPNA